ncbi:hypothetical protein PMAYCL1PPCAC_19444, partial [Pristionchus mayeri]
HKILVYNVKFAYAHSNMLGSIADLLVEAGHDVTSFIPEIASEIKDGTSKSKIVKVLPNPEAALYHERLHNGELNPLELNTLNLIVAILARPSFAFMFAKQCVTTLDSGEVEKLQKEHFDVYIVESLTSAE